MVPGTITEDWTIFAGEDVSKVFDLKNDAGSPLDLTGITGAEYVFVDTRTQQTLVQPKALNTGITVEDAAGGKIKVELIAWDSEVLAGRFRHVLSIQTGALWRVRAAGFLIINLGRGQVV